MYRNTDKSKKKKTLKNRYAYFVPHWKMDIMS